MLVYYFVEIVRPFAVVEARLLDDLEGVAAQACRAYRDGERFGAEIASADLGAAETIQVTVGLPVRLGGRTTLPLRWKAAGATSLFPAMEADLLLTPLGTGHTHLAFRGSYEPAGGQIRRPVLHHVAEGTVRRFTDRLAASLAHARRPLGHRPGSGVASARQQAATR